MRVRDKRNADRRDATVEEIDTKGSGGGEEQCAEHTTKATEAVGTFQTQSEKVAIKRVRGWVRVDSAREW